MVKKAVYFGRTLGKWSWCTARTKTRAVTVVRVGNGNPEVSSELATKHRAAFALVVYLAQDRLDLRVAAVELARSMAILTEGDDERLKRVARYLHGHPDYLQWYIFQEDTDTTVLSTDAVWAKC